MNGEGKVDEEKEWEERDSFMRKGRGGGERRKKRGRKREMKKRRRKRGRGEEKKEITSKYEHTQHL